LVLVSGCRGCCASVEDSVDACFDQLRAALEHAGLGLEHVAFVQLTLADMNDFGRANTAYCRHFAGSEAAPAPSRACVQVELRDGALAQLSALCAHTPRVVLHVRSLSQWAPLCIGPYAQCNMVQLAPADLLCVAGQIALDPWHMTLAPEAPAREQLALALQHCGAIVDAHSRQVGAAAPLRSAARLLTVYLSEAAGALEPVRAALAALLPEPPALFVRLERLPRGAAVETELLAVRSAEPLGAARVERRASCAVSGLALDIAARGAGVILTVCPSPPASASDLSSLSLDSALADAVVAELLAALPPGALLLKAWFERAAPAGAELAAALARSAAAVALPARTLVAAHSVESAVLCLVALAVREPEQD
jgi:diphthine-ammonia ligase